MGKENLRLWDDVCTTDPDYTKQYKGVGGFEGTAINSTYQIRKATEAFGPVGIGWGYTVLSERFDKGNLFVGKDEDKSVIHEGIGAIVHTLHLRLWYILDGKRGEVEHFGHTPFVYQNKYGANTENEPSKKSLTDAIGKCLSMLGFSADIFMGEYDNAEYVDQVKAESAIEKAENREEEIAAQRAELSEYVMRHIESIKTAQTANEVNGIAKTAIRYLERRKTMKDMTEIATKGVAAIGREAETKKATFERAEK